MKIHIAQKGETLWNIAKKYNVSFEELKNNNTQLSSPEAMYPGMKIKVPVAKVAIPKKTEVASVENQENQQGNEQEMLYRNAETSVPQNVFSSLLPNQSVSKPDLNEQTQDAPPLFTKTPFAIPVAPPPPIVNTTHSNTTVQKDPEPMQQPQQPQPFISPQQLPNQQLNNVQGQTEPVQGYYETGYQQYPNQYYQQDCGCSDQYQYQYQQYGYQVPQVLPAPIPGYFQPYGQYPQQVYQQYPNFQQPQIQPQQPLTPAYPFPTTNFQGQGYPDYYRDTTNPNYGVPPIDEEEL